MDRRPYSADQQNESRSLLLSVEERLLSDRERTVLLLAAEGLTDKEIAKHLSLSQRTIGTYWERMRVKLGPFSRTQLVARFLRYQTDGARTLESYRDLFAPLDEGVMIIGGDGVPVYANRAFCTLLKMSEADVLNGDPERFLVEQLGPQAGRLLAQARSESSTTDLSIGVGDATKHLRIKVFPILDRRGSTSVIAFFMRDLTVKHRLLQSLSVSQEAMNALAKLCGVKTERFAREAVNSKSVPNALLTDVQKCLETGIPTISLEAQQRTFFIPEFDEGLAPSAVFCITL